MAEPVSGSNSWILPDKLWDRMEKLVHLGLLWVVLEFSEKRTLEKRDGRQRTLPTHSWA